MGNKQLNLLIYPDNIRTEGTPLYVVYLNDMTVDIACLMVNQNRIISIDCLIITENRKFTLHRQLMAGNMLSMRTYDAASRSIDAYTFKRLYTSDKENRDRLHTKLVFSSGETKLKVIFANINSNNDIGLYFFI